MGNAVALFSIVIPAKAGIHVFPCVKAWMAGSSRAMTTKDVHKLSVVIPAKAGIQ